MKRPARRPLTNVETTNIGAQEGVAAPGPTVVVISSDVMGQGDDELGQVLLRNYLHTLAETASVPDTLIFYNAGVRLAVEGSPSLDDLRILTGRGAHVQLCGTCLGHFGLKEKVAIGEVSNMYAISEAMLHATKVINIC